ncbi:hypothetical protein ACIF8T_27875 [Streptomyces sp. NPDC085946]
MSARPLTIAADKTVPRIVLPDTAAELRPASHRRARIAGAQAFVRAGW